MDTDGQVVDKIGDFFSVSETLRRMVSTKGKVKKLTDRFSSLTGAKLENLYITYSYEGDVLKLKDLWLFSKKCVMVVDNFEQIKFEPKKEESLRFFSITKKISQIKVTSSECKFGVDDVCFDNSTLKLDCTTSDNIPIVLEAWGYHCPILATIIKLLIQNLV